MLNPLILTQSPRPPASIPSGPRANVLSVAILLLGLGAGVAIAVGSRSVIGIIAGVSLALFDL